MPFIAQVIETAGPDAGKLSKGVLLKAESSDSSDEEMEIQAFTERENEEMIVRDYLECNPPPSYEEVNKEMMELQPTMPCMMVWQAEYGEWNHETLCDIRRDILDYEKTKAHGQLIYNRGGMQALSANYYIFKMFFCKSPILRGQCTDSMFHGVGDGDSQWLA